MRISHLVANQVGPVLSVPSNQSSFRTAPNVPRSRDAHRAATVGGKLSSDGRGEVRDGQASGQHNEGRGRAATWHAGNPARRPRRYGAARTGGRWAIEGRVRGSDQESRRGHPRLTPVVSERTNRTPACDTLSHHRATGRQGEDGRRDTVIGESEGYPVRSHMSQRPLIAEQLRKRRSAACPPARGSGTA